MPTPKRGARLGSGPEHQKLMLSSLATDLFVHGRIRTTEAKAKTLRPYAERLITKAKRGDLNARRQVLSDLRDRDVVAYLFEEVAPRFSERSGGYTRILKLAPRKGDNAKMAFIELVDRGDEGEGEDFVEESRAKRARGLFGRLRRRREQPTDEWDVTDELDLDGQDLGGEDVDDELDVEDLAGEVEQAMVADQTAAEPDTDDVTAALDEDVAAELEAERSVSADDDAAVDETGADQDVDGEDDDQDEDKDARD